LLDLGDIIVERVAWAAEEFDWAVECNVRAADTTITTMLTTIELDEDVKI
jgi:hypothetical protein